MNKFAKLMAATSVAASLMVASFAAQANTAPMNSPGAPKSQKSAALKIYVGASWGMGDDFLAPTGAIYDAGTGAGAVATYTDQTRALQPITANLAVGLEGIYNFTRNIGVVLGIAYVDSDYGLDGGGTLIVDGSASGTSATNTAFTDTDSLLNITNTPLYLGLSIGSQSNKMSFNAMVALLYSWNNINTEVGYTDAIAKAPNSATRARYSDLAFEMDNSWGGMIGAGVAFAVSRQMSIGVDLRWMTTKADYTVTGTRTAGATPVTSAFSRTTTDFTMSNVMLLVGLTYKF